MKYVGCAVLIYFLFFALKYALGLSMLSCDEEPCNCSSSCDVEDYEPVE